MKRKLNHSENRKEKVLSFRRRGWMICLLFMMVMMPSLLYSQNQQQITLHLKNATAEQVIREMKQTTRYKFFYRVEDLPSTPLRDYDFKDATLEQVMNKLVENTTLTWSINNGTVVIAKKKTQQTDALSGKAKGKVEDATGEPLPGASVIIKGTQKGVSSDVNGEFKLEGIPESGAVLRVSFIGMKSKDVPVSYGSDMTIRLENDVTQMEDVVITGYQTISKERVTGAFSVVSAKTLENKLQTSIVDNMEGLIPGMLVRNGEISIRGVSTLYSNNKPLYIVDGFPWEGDIQMLSSDNIQNITILKDAAAASIYGARSANGVIVITTKSGQVGKTNISLSANFFVTPLPSTSNRNLLSSSELVDLQSEFFNAYKKNYNLVKKEALPEVVDLMYQRQRGLIGSDAELNTQLDRLRNLDRTKQFKDLLLRPLFKQQYTLNVSGGSERNTYFMSADYLDEQKYNQGEGSRRININLKDNLRITSWLDAEVSTMTSFTNTESSPINGINLLSTTPSFRMLTDENGNTLPWNYGKSQEEKNRLISKGLNDERYNPLDEIRNTDISSNSYYLRLSAAMNAQLAKGIRLSVMYQIGKGSSKTKKVYGADSYFVRNMINNAAQVDAQSGITYNIPQGGQLMETRGGTSAYTLRGQLNVDRNFAERHNVTAVLGAERQKVENELTNSYRMGYDDRGLTWAMIDAKMLSSGLKGTESTNGLYQLYDYDKKNSFEADEDRYISFFGNFGYTYDSRYSITGSVRIDESNLFGTDPKYRHAPLWSVGGSWNITNENFMKDFSFLNRLVLRATYGINGNIAKQTGPYIIMKSGYDSNNETSYNTIISPPNDQLRWEKTKTVNAGIDISVLNNRLGLSFDYYRKQSSDLLGYVAKDPTLGWESVMVNYGAMRNNGIELSLNSLNIKNRNFEWRSSLIYSHNSNKLTNCTAPDQTINSYLSGAATENYPLNPMFSYNYAGLSEKGLPLVYNENGDKASGVQDSKALIYGGTSTPKYTGSFTNNFVYRGFELSFMFIFNGGNVMREIISPYIANYQTITANVNRDILNRWKQPGDELKTGVTPGFDFDAPYTRVNLWRYNHNNVVKADYIRLRNISFSYNLPDKYLRTVKLSGLQFHFQVQNAWLWTANDQKIDPESNMGGSSEIKPFNIRPTYIFGINLKL